MDPPDKKPQGSMILASLQANAVQESWIVAIDYSSLAINCFGIVSNMLVLITVSRSNFLQRKASLLIGHQALVDFLVCIVGILKMVYYDNVMINTGNLSMTILVCYTWTSQLIFWFLVFVSVQVLVLIALDRYMAVARPVKYRAMGVRNYIIANVLIYFFSLFINAAVLVDTVWFDGQNCHGNKDSYGKTIGLYGTRTYQCVGFLWLCFIYFFPSSFLVVFYSMTLKSYHRVKFIGNSAMSRHRRQITSQLMKSSIVVTALYIVAFTVDAVYMLMALFGEADFRDTSDPINRVGSLFINFHSINPLIYCLMMKTFRYQVLLTMSCGKYKKIINNIAPVRQITSVMLKPESEISVITKEKTS